MNSFDVLFIKGFTVVQTIFKDKYSQQIFHYFRAVLWNEDDSMWYDYNLKTNKHKRFIVFDIKGNVHEK